MNTGRIIQRIRTALHLAFSRFMPLSALSSLTARFIQRCAKGFQKGVEVYVVEARLQVCLSRIDV